MQIATGPLHQAVESLVPALLIGARFLVVAPSSSAEPGPTAQRLCNLRAEASVHKDGTMLCNASTGDGGGAFSDAMT